MIDSSHVLFTATIVLPAIVSVAVFYFDQKHANRLPYATRQIIIGIIFGGLAILGTEWGLEVKGVIVNTRDAPVLCAGLLFGGPAGIIAGILGGVERYVAVFWGAGTYTQIGCSVSTILAGFLAAGIRRFPLENKRPSWIIGFVSGLVMEAFHFVMIVVTHLDDLSTVINVVLVCIAPMLAACAFSVMFATIAVTVAANGGIKRIPPEEKSVRRTFQSRLLISFVVVFTLCSAVVFLAETVVCRTTNGQYLEQQLTNIKAMGLDALADKSAASSDDGYDCQRMGETGYIVISQRDSGEIVSAPNEFYGKTMDEIGLGQEAETNPSPITTGAADCSYLYNATVNGIDCECMDSFQGSYRTTAVYPEEEALLARNRAFVLTLLIQILLFAAIFTLSDLIVYRYVVRPVHRINESLQNITDGDLDTVVNERSNLEFGQLSDGTNATVASLQEYAREAERRIEQDLELAHNIQHAALPSHFPPYPGRKEMDIFARMETAKIIGGDFYDFYFSSENTLCFLVADVSGKGIPAAMFMMRVKTLLRDLAESGFALDEMAKRTNELLRADNKSAMFVTLWVGSINLETGLVTYVNAGHNPPLVCHGNGVVERVVGKHDFVLGVAKNTSYECQELQLEEGDTIFLYTDGVTEAMNGKGEFFGGDRLCASLSNACSCAVEEVCETVMADLGSFVQDAPQADDITMLALRFNGNAKKDFLIVPAKIDYLPQVMDALVGKLREEKASQNVLRRVSTVIDELFVNVARYAYVEHEGGIEIRSSVNHIDEDGVGKVLFEMTLIDAGEAFNPLENEAPDVQAPACERMNGGYGIMIVRKLMDSVEYKREGNRNILTMTLSFVPEQELL